MENFNYFQTRLLPHETQAVRTNKTASPPPIPPPSSALGWLVHDPATRVSAHDGYPSSARISRIDGCGPAATVSGTSPALCARP